MEPYLVLLRVGFAVPVCCQTRGALLPHRFTLATHVLRHRSAVCSLLHFPSARAAQALPGTLPCGARTFLPCLAAAATVRPTPARRLRRSPPGHKDKTWGNQPFRPSARSYSAFFLSPVMLAANAAACFTGSSSSRMPSTRSASCQSCSPTASGNPSSTSTISPRC